MQARERIETRRLLSSRPVLADADSIYHRNASDSEVTRFLTWPRHRSMDDTRTFIRFSDAQWCSRKAQVLADFPNVSPGVSPGALRYELVIA